MIKKIFTPLCGNENILCFNEDSDVLFSRNEMSNLNIDLNKINIDNNFDENDPDTIILIRLLAWHIKFEKRKELKKFKQRIYKKYIWRINDNSVLIPKDWCFPEDEKKEIETIFIEEL